MPIDPRAVVLVSGGLDSAVVLAHAAHRFNCYALTFRYGQRHSVEVEAAKDVAHPSLVADHVIVDLDFRPFAKASSLTNSDLAVPTTARDGIPNTYVPARNTIFLSYALAYAESVGARDIFIGANAIDYSGYPDCRPEYLQAFECLANLATRAGVEGQNLRRAVGARESPPLRIHAPLLPMGKAQIVRYGIELGVNFGETHSCYDPVLAASLTSLRGSRALACGECDSCRIRLAGFAAAGISDPVPYVDARSSQSP